LVMKILKNRRLRIVLWLVLYLVIIDIAVNILFRFPLNPQKMAPSFLQGYFEYGRSIEGKFTGMIKSARLQAEPTLGYGWLEKKSNSLLPQKAGADQTLVAVYGMSHTKLLGEAMAKVNSKYIIHNVTAPGAPVGWSYTAYDIDREKQHADVVILGIMTDNIALMGATSGATTYFDLGHPYTFPRYNIENGKLRSSYPPFFTEEGFDKYFSDIHKWHKYRDWLKKNDKYYSSLLFIESPLDHSALLRVARRAYADYFKNRLAEKIYNKNGFNLNSEEIKILRAMIVEFALSARAQKKKPIVYIINNEGRSDHLYQALKPELNEYEILHLSSHIICPPDNPKVYLGTNSHFTPAKDIELAKAMIEIIEKEQKK
jgi:hypothetical protein